MTNITLSIDDKVYKKMREHSEIKWSEFVRKIVSERIEMLEKLEKLKNKIKDEETLFGMLVSEEVMKKEWDNEADERWNDL